MLVCTPQIKTWSIPRAASRFQISTPESLMLILPRPFGIAADTFEQFVPLGEFDRVVVFPSIRLIDGIDFGVFAFDGFAPLTDVGG